MNHMYYDVPLYEALKGFGLLLKSRKEKITRRDIDRKSHTINKQQELK